MLVPTVQLVAAIPTIVFFITDLNVVVILFEILNRVTIAIVTLSVCTVWACCWFCMYVEIKCLSTGTSEI